MLSKFDLNQSLMLFRNLLKNNHLTFALVFFKFENIYIKFTIIQFNLFFQLQEMKVQNKRKNDSR